MNKLVEFYDCYIIPSLVTFIGEVQECLDEDENESYFFNVEYNGELWQKNADTKEEINQMRNQLIILCVPGINSGKTVNPPTIQ